MKRKLLVTVMVVALVLTFAVPAMAAITKYAVTSPEGTMYVYDYQELSQSFMNHYLGIPGAELFNDYARAGTLTALYDSEKGWVDYNDIKSAYYNAVLSAQTFDLATYVQNQAVAADMPPEVQEVAFENGQIVRTRVQLGQQLPAIKSFEAVPSLEMGKKLVIVELDTDTPEKYEVYVKDTKLEFNAEAGKFIGDVPDADAIEANVEIKLVEQAGEDFEVISIE